MSQPVLEDAIALAAKLHQGQKELGGRPYILHPLQVMLDPTLTSNEERIVAVLHDVVEDCNITLAELADMGYSSAVVEALDYLTKRPHEEADYEAFIERVSTGPLLARKVKLADLRHNCDLTRIPTPTQKDWDRQAKYLRAIAKLESI